MNLMGSTDTTRIEPFEKYAQEYDQWFEINKHAYDAELRAVRTMLPGAGRMVEVGLGTGRFSAPLGITLGIEPSAAMRKIALSRAIEAVDGRAECLPFSNSSLDVVLMVTTLCFLNDVDTAFNEVHRVLTPAGWFIIGFVDKKSRLGKMYEQNRSRNPFFRMATFYSVEEVLGHLNRTGFRRFDSVQTLFHDLEQIAAVEPVTRGTGEGSFVVIRAGK